QSDWLQTEESGDNHNLGSPSWPRPQDPDQPYRILGRSIPAELGDSDADDHIRLPAVSPVSPFFAGYYPHCRNVFGFHDDLPAENIENVSLAYSICGWYRDAGEKEPFAEITSLEELRERFGLDFTGKTWPDRTLCHGMVDGIRWETKSTLYPSGIPDDPPEGEVVEMPRLAIGNTAADAVAALTAHGNSDGGGERLLAYFLNDLEHFFADRSGILDAEQHLHGTAFATRRPDDIPNIKRKEGCEKAPPPDRETLERLSFLRQRCRQAFEDRAVLRQMQRDVYENWYLQANADEEYAEMYRKRMVNGYAAAVAYDTALADRMHAIDQEVKAFDPGEGYEVIAQPDEPYRVPNDPVLVVSQLVHDQKASENAYLSCRLTGETISQMSVSTPDLETVLVGEEICPGLGLPDGIPKEAPLLATETALLANSFARHLAVRAYEEKKPTESQIHLLSKKIQAAQRYGRPVEGISFDNAPPDETALQRYHPRWYPLILEWQGYYAPDRDLVGSTPSFINWELQGEEYGLANPALSPEESYPVQARLFISDTASRTMQALARWRFADNADFRAAVRSANRLSQALGGFNDLLLMRSPALSPALFTSDPEEQSLLDLIKRLDPAVASGTPVFDLLFSPIRAGFLSLGQVRIIDALGRFQDIANPAVYADESMRAGGNNPVTNVLLPPRLVQPSRLEAYWLRAGDGVEASFVETASPLCGFVLPSRLSHSLMVYSAGGLPVGSLQATETDSRILWKSPPDVPSSSDIPGDLDPDLHMFLQGLKDGGRDALQDFLEYLNRLMYYIHPGSHPAHSLEFIGKPLALARFSLAFRVLGEKERYRHYEENEPDPSEDVDVDHLLVPVALGRRDDPQDGLIGFFPDRDFSRMRILDNVGPKPKSSYCVQDNVVHLPAKKCSPATVVTVLVEPWSEVCMTSGILPVKNLRLPEELVAQALENVTVTFLAAPVLASEQPEFPLPAAGEADFVWHHLVADDAWKARTLDPRDPLARMEGYPRTAVEGYLEIKEKEAPHGDGATDIGIS
ncbi:MAG: hypothetical protein LUG50_00090, partial [Planctomycetaceae bacterium]|nr:hypothetical protein [Planctomycetaceae bacterium]